MVVLILAVYIAVILVRPMDWWEPILGWQLVTVGAVATFAVGWSVVLGRFRRIWREVPQLKLAIVFLVGTVLSWLPRLWFGGMQHTFQEFGKVIFFFVLLLTLVGSRHDYKFLLWAFLLSVGWMAIHAILQHHLGVGFGDQAPLWRSRGDGEYVLQSIAFGTFNDPNDLCLVLVFAIPLFYVQFKTSLNPVQKLSSLAGVILCAYAAYCTNSRGGVVTVFGMLVAYTLARLKGMKRYLMGSAAVGLVTILAPSRFSGSMAGRDRSILWGDGLAMFKSSPLFGMGYGQFTDYSSEHLVAHNTYIHTLAELGLVGYLPLFLILYLTIVQLRRLIRLRNQIPHSEYLLLTGIFSALSGYFTGMYFVSRQYQHILYVVLSLAIILVYVLCENYGLKPQVFGTVKKDLRQGLLWGLGSVVVMWVTVRLVNAIS
jgi:O-antigen ligase